MIVHDKFPQMATIKVYFILTHISLKLNYGDVDLRITEVQFALPDHTETLDMLWTIWRGYQMFPHRGHYTQSAVFSESNCTVYYSVKKKLLATKD